MNDAMAGLIAGFGGAVRAVGAGVEISDPGVLQSEAMDRLVWAAVFGGSDEQSAARALLWDLGQATGVRPASTAGCPAPAPTPASCCAGASRAGARIRVSTATPDPRPGSWRT